MTTKKLRAAKRSKKMEEKVGKIDKKRHEQGMMLVLALIVSFAMLVVAVPFLFKLSAQYRSAERFYKALTALNLAEAGAERAIWEINHGDISAWDVDDGLRTLMISDFQDAEGNVIGDIEISVGYSTGSSETYVIESTGKVPYLGTYKVAKKVQVILTRPIPVLPDFSIFTTKKVKFYEDTLFDSYNSKDGDYGGDNMHKLGNIGTNSTKNDCINIEMNAEIYGNMSSGPESDTDKTMKIDETAVVHGELNTLSEIVDLPPASPPEGLPFMDDYNLNNGDVGTIDQNAEYHDFKLGKNSKLTIEEDVVLYVNHDFKMEDGATLEIAEEASLKIYVGHKFEVKKNGQINNLKKDPAKLVVVGTVKFKEDVTLEDGSVFYGVIYSPRNKVDIKEYYDFYGSVICKEFKMHSYSNFHFDEALKDANSLDGISFIFTVKSWQEKKGQLITSD